MVHFNVGFGAGFDAGVAPSAAEPTKTMKRKKKKQIQILGA